MKYYTTIIFILATLLLKAQDISLESVFSDLAGKTWIANGQWGDGNPFKQEITFALDLDNSLVRTHTMGFVDSKQSSWGKRAHGIRRYDTQTRKYHFMEFDVFGNLTEGLMEIKESKIYYHYPYGSGDQQLELTDVWEKKDNNTYSFKVGVFKNGKWEQVFLDTEFIALPEFSGNREALNSILTLTKQFSKTYVAGDHEALSMMYTMDGKIMPGGPRIIEGRSDIAAYWKLPDGISLKRHEVQPEKIQIYENHATDYGYYSGTTQRSDGDLVDWQGKYVIIWKKVDDQWLIDVDIWNPVTN